MAMNPITLEIMIFFNAKWKFRNALKIIQHVTVALNQTEQP